MVFICIMTGLTAAVLPRSENRRSEVDPFPWKRCVTAYSIQRTVMFRKESLWYRCGKSWMEKAIVIS
jgi:hypothetical protein